MQNYQNFDLVSKFQKNCAYLGGYCGKTEGGSEKFWSLAIYIIYNKKVQNSVFLSAALHGENGFQVWKWDFLLFFPIFTKGI